MNASRTNESTVPFSHASPHIAEGERAVTIETPWRGCWRVVLNGRPQADWCNLADAKAHANRLRGRGLAMTGERIANAVNAANELPQGVILAVGPQVRSA